MQSLPITTNVVSSNPVHGEVYSMQHYVIKFVCDLRQVDGFLRVLRFSPPIKLDCHDITEILVKVALNTINQTKLYHWCELMINSDTCFFHDLNSTFEVQNICDPSSTSVSTKYWLHSTRWRLCQRLQIQMRKVIIVCWFTWISI
jgi:hypothetical protein